MSLIQIREAKTSDAPILFAAEQHWARTPGHLLSAPDELKSEAFAQKIRELSDLPNGRYVVAEYDGRPAGHAYVEPLKALRSVSHVVSLTIVVHPGCERRGVGQALMRDLIDWARRTETVEKIELRVRATNQRAIALYKKMGFLEEGRARRRVKNSDGTYVDDMAMGLFPKMQLARLSANSIETMQVQMVFERAPRYFMSVQGHTAGPNEAQAAFSALPPGVPSERKYSFGIRWGERLIGFADVIYGYPNPSFAYIGLLLLTEDWQARGLGRQAYQLIEQQICTWPGVKTIRIGVAETTNVTGFWTKMGFQPTGRRLPSASAEIPATILEMDKRIGDTVAEDSTFTRPTAVFLFVDDIFPSALWYQKLLSRAPVHQDETFAAFKLGDHELCLHKADAKSPASAGGSVGYWWTNDFEGTVQHALSLGASLYRGPASIPGARKICQLQDPFGNVIGLEGAG